MLQNALNLPVNGKVRTCKHFDVIKFSKKYYYYDDDDDDDNVRIYRVGQK